MNLKRENGTAASVAKACDYNGEYGTATIEQTASTAMRLPKSIVSRMEEVVDIKETAMHLSDERLNKVRPTIVDEMVRLFDSLPYSNF